jgi:small-conductance mechanosensitive channel
VLEALEVRLVLVVLSIFLILVFQWILRSIIDKKIKNMKKISLEVVNLSKILLNLFTLASILFLIVILIEIPPEQVVGISALLGAIISFGSTETLANFIAGLYILFTHPFGVNDFVEFDEIKGEVVEISLNYTRIRTVNNLHHYIPNKKFFTKNIINFNKRIKRSIGTSERQETHSSRMKTLKDFALSLIEEEVVSYTFLWGAPLSDLSSTKQKLQEVCDIYAGVFGYKPEFFLFSLGYRMKFLFIVTTYNPKILTNNIQEFRNEIVSRFH